MPGRLHTSGVRIARGTEESPGTHDSSIEAEGDPEQASTVPGSKEELLGILPRSSKVQESD